MNLLISLYVSRRIGLNDVPPLVLIVFNSKLVLFHETSEVYIRIKHEKATYWYGLLNVVFLSSLTAEDMIAKSHPQYLHPSCRDPCTGFFSQQKNLSFYFSLTSFATRGAVFLRSRPIHTQFGSGSSIRRKQQRPTSIRGYQYWLQGWPHHNVPIFNNSAAFTWYCRGTAKGRALVAGSESLANSRGSRPHWKPNWFHSWRSSWWL